MYLSVHELELAPKPLSQSPSSNTKCEEATSTDGTVQPPPPQISQVHANKKLNINCHLFDNFEQEAYYITGRSNITPPEFCTPSATEHDYSGRYITCTDSMYSLSTAPPPRCDESELGVHYLAKRLTNTTFVHYPSADQLSLNELERESNVAAAAELDYETVADPMDPEEYSVSQLLLRLAEVEEEIFLTQHGYKPVGKLCDTLQGDLIKCEVVPVAEDTNGDGASTKKKRGKNLKACLQSNREGFVAIKRTNKQLFKQRISKMDNGFNICVEENIEKEAQILKYLTSEHKSTEYVIKYVDFFQSENDYYLVMEYIDGDCNLKQFMQKAHKLMEQHKLDLKQYHKIIKYVFWQIAAVLHWLHYDMHCAHLDLNLENVMLKNANFVENADGSITIDGAISARLGDFGCAEVFKPRHEDDDQAYLCVKQGAMLGEIQYQCPKIVEEQVYDARKADNYALGMMLFQCIFGVPLYSKLEETPGSGYWAIQHEKINQWILLNNLTECVNGKLLTLLNGLLCLDQTKRLHTLEILKSRWFKSYFKRYQDKLEKKSAIQKKKLQHLRHKMKGFAFYEYPRP
eukprot:CAMPEP_0197038082 /NCGR_PEP_ID=MMETSP1384-20130603/15112_1 /TAXON_ID=29189 /ORGANISM="Ammonia sp." /LENGTH=573 /DNA_ID=CAMNT_0042468475 /DNA_START=81 /DNA_END=1802 /DNA_ORIENTATION=-